MVFFGVQVNLGGGRTGANGDLTRRAVEGVISAKRRSAARRIVHRCGLSRRRGGANHVCGLSSFRNLRG